MPAAPFPAWCLSAAAIYSALRPAPIPSRLALEPTAWWCFCHHGPILTPLPCFPARLRPAACLQGGLAGSEAQIEAVLQLRCAYPRAVLAVNALAGFACASLQEDRFGILQLTQACGDMLLPLWLGMAGNPLLCPAQPPCQSAAGSSRGHPMPRPCSPAWVTCCSAC